MSLHPYLPVCLQRRAHANVVAQKAISRVQERLTLKVTFWLTLRARRVPARTSGTSSSVAGGSISHGGSTMTRSHQQTTLLRWPDSKRLHLARRLRRVRSRDAFRR